MRAEYSKISPKELKILNELFKNLDFLSIDNYVNSSWDVIYFHSAPFLELPIYSCIISLMNFFEEPELNIFCNPLRRNTNYLKISKPSASFEQFNSVLEEYNFTYTGGYGYSENKKFGFVSCSDIEIFSIGYEKASGIHAPDIYSNNPLVVSKDFAYKSLNEHLAFLKS
ncbi:MAG: hypothetical protein KAX50_02715 [Saprospiraceae bacterium]|nr:hypothetical protein [Saprospiraceae bacterium]